MVAKRAYEISWHEALRGWFFYLPAGHAEDGAPLVYATRLHAEEAMWWQEGRIDLMEYSLRQRGIPLPGPCGFREGKWRRFLKSLRRKLLGGKA